MSTLIDTTERELTDMDLAVTSQRTPSGMIRQYRREWPLLTRYGQPNFVIARREILYAGKVYAPGDLVTEPLVSNKIRMRQFYEGRMIDPITSQEMQMRFQEQIRAEHVRVEGINAELAAQKKTTQTAPTEPMYHAPAKPAIDPSKVISNLPGEQPKQNHNNKNRGRS